EPGTAGGFDESSERFGPGPRVRGFCLLVPPGAPVEPQSLHLRPAPRQHHLGDEARAVANGVGVIRKPRVAAERPLERGLHGTVSVEELHDGYLVAGVVSDSAGPLKTYPQTRRKSVTGGGQSDTSRSSPSRTQG